jgi:hypothetical protein
MSAVAPLESKVAGPVTSSSPAPNSHRTLLQRKCACGSATASLTGECPECKRKKLVQTKLAIGASNDPLEQEADRVANQVLAVPAATSRTPPVIQRSSGVAAVATASAPPSVDRVLAGSGQPLEPALRQDMEQRFGHDFSRVRIHAGAAASQSAREVQARAFTAGHDIVFGAGEPGLHTREGTRLLAHELTHVIQQGSAAPGKTPASASSGHARPSTLQRQPSGGKGGLLDDLGLGDVEKEVTDFGKGLINGAEQEVRNQLRALSALPGTGAVFSNPACPSNFCNPFADVGEARKNLVLTAPVLLAGVAKVVSPRVVPLWSQYLFGGASPQNLTSQFGADFTASTTTAKTATFICNQLKTEIRGNHKAILGSAAAATVDLTPRMPKTLAAIDNPTGANAMDFNVIGDIAGNIAGGIGKDQLASKIGSKPSPFNDERTAVIRATLTRTAKGIKVNPDIVFTIRDTIDLCPGNCGAATEQDATIPMSRFEATGLSGDVPFEITFPAPPAALAEFEVPVAWPAPAKAPAKPKKPAKKHALNESSEPGSQLEFAGQETASNDDETA